MKYQQYDLTGQTESEKEMTLRKVWAQQKALTTNNGRKMYHKPMTRKGTAKRKNKKITVLFVDEAYMLLN